MITLWSFIETELSVLYSHFIGRYDDLDALTEYGEGSIFRKRFAIIADAACRHFARCPHQSFEAEFDRLGALLNGFSDRRNEIAHGVVSRADHVQWFREHLEVEVRSRPNYMVLPPFHWKAKRGPDGFPSFAYTSRELLELGERLFTIAQRIRAYLAVMLPAERRSELPPAPSGLSPWK